MGMLANIEVLAVPLKPGMTEKQKSVLAAQMVRVMSSTDWTLQSYGVLGRLLSVSEEHQELLSISCKYLTDLYLSGDKGSKDGKLALKLSFKQHSSNVFISAWFTFFLDFNVKRLTEFITQFKVEFPDDRIPCVREGALKLLAWDSYDPQLKYWKHRRYDISDGVT